MSLLGDVVIIVKVFKSFPSLFQLSQSPARFAPLEKNNIRILL